MEQPRILKEHAGEEDFYQLLDAVSSFSYVVALWSHTPLSAQETTAFPLHYFENDGWIAASNSPLTSGGHSGSLCDLRNAISHNKNHLFGFFSYDLKNELEELHSTGTDPFSFPSYFFFEPELLFRFQNGRIECLNISHEWFEYLMNAMRAADSDRILPLTENGTHFAAPTNSGEKVEFVPVVSRAEYEKNVQIIRQHIAEGNVYELNYCIEWQAQSVQLSPIETWKSMNQRTQAPFSAYVRMDHHFLMSASPERFMCKHGKQVCSQPIKGTASRNPDPNLDAKNTALLSMNKKERAENLMIVDLVRNDLSRSCVPGSVIVPELCSVFTLKTVHQMYSTVCGELRPQTHPLDALLASFPMGSMTGAPKISAMKLIDKLETFKRGLFSGSVGYFTPQGDFDFNVVIRSMLYRSDTKQAVVRAGSAITYDSDAEQEWDECQLKANAIINCV